MQKSLKSISKMYLINIIPTQKEKEAQKEKTTDEYHQETKLLKKRHLTTLNQTIGQQFHVIYTRSMK